MIRLVLLFACLLTCCNAFLPSVKTAYPSHSSLWLSGRGKSGYKTDVGYSTIIRPRFLDRWEQAIMQREQRRKESMEDGYAEMFDKQLPLGRRLLRIPFRIAERILRRPQEPGTLILVRHGQSEWNANQVSLYQLQL